MKLILLYTRHLLNLLIKIFNKRNDLYIKDLIRIYFVKYSHIYKDINRKLIDLFVWIHLCINFLFNNGFEFDKEVIFADPGFFGWANCPALVVFELTFFLRYSDFLPFKFVVPAKLVSFYFYFYFAVFRLLWAWKLSL